MPVVDVDVQNIPDIIEAQLTLSYSRLSDLIRLIIEQGNGHDDDIEGMRDRLDALEKENSELRKEVEGLKGGSGASLEEALRELQRRVEELGRSTEEHARQISDNESARQAHETKTREALEVVQEASDKHESHISTHAEDLRQLRAFKELWEAEANALLEMGGRDADGNLEHDVDERTAYLHSLPAFAKLFEELEVLRGMLQKQAADALSAKTAVNEYNRSRSLTGLENNNNNNNNNERELMAAMEALHNLEGRLRAVETERLPPLEAARGGGGGGGEAASADNNNNDELQRRVNHLQDDVKSLEERLLALLNGAGADGERDYALEDLRHRVELLEESIDGIPFANMGGNNNNNNTDNNAGTATEVEPSSAIPRKPGTPPTYTANDAFDDGASSGGAPALPPSPPGGKRTPTPPLSAAGAGGAAAAAARPPSGNGRLPPIAPATPTNNNTNTTTTNNNTTNITNNYHQGGGGAGAKRQSVSMTPFQRISQPNVEALRSEERTSPAAAADRRASRRISVALEQEDGLRRRVAQLEENTAILEINKADRAELRALSELLAQLQGAGVGVGPHGAEGYPPSSSSFQQPPQYMAQPRGGVDYVGAGSGAYAGGPYNYADGRLRGSVGGRPMYVGSSSVYLRDGARMTAATVAPMHLIQQQQQQMSRTVS